MKRIMIECDNCKHKMTEKAYADFPECSECGGHYVTKVVMVEFRTLSIGQRFRLTGCGPILMCLSCGVLGKKGVYLQGSRRGYIWQPIFIDKLVYPVEDGE